MPNHHHTFSAQTNRHTIRNTSQNADDTNLKIIAKICSCIMLTLPFTKHIYPIPNSMQMICDKLENALRTSMCVSCMPLNPNTFKCVTTMHRFIAIDMDSGWKKNDSRVWFYTNRIYCVEENETLTIKMPNSTKNCDVICHTTKFLVFAVRRYRFSRRARFLGFHQMHSVLTFVPCRYRIFNYMNTFVR